MATRKRKLESCPLCGSPAIIVDFVWEGKTKYYIKCAGPYDCPILTEVGKNKTQLNKIIKKWNNRKENEK